MAIRGLTFDAYGTLFDVHSIVRLAEQLFPGSGSQISILWRQKQIEYSQLSSLSDPSPGGSLHYRPFRELTEAALRYSLKRLKLPFTDGHLQLLMDRYDQLEAYPECPSVLEYIKLLGLPTAILSNGSPEMLTGAVNSSGLESLFDHVISVDEVKQFKTHPACYDLAPSALKLKPQEILFVSSNAWDILGANWYGFTTCWVNREGLPFETIGRQPHYILANLSALFEIIQHNS
jgi:2-haloacid dehalogenase|tara:strand:- start:5191 stop:5889 length:699 start_codon:yes stop_codon:yes gene_type:complete